MSNQPADLPIHRLKIDLSSDPVEVRPFEVRPVEARAGEVCTWFDRVAVDLHDDHATCRPIALPEGPDRPGLSAGPVAAGEYRLPPPPQTGSS